MQVLRHRIELDTVDPIQFLDITDIVERWVASTSVKDGLLSLICLHTTARITINEREPQLQRDMVAYLTKLVPSEGPWLHNMASGDGRDNAHSHLLGLFMCATETIPIANGKPVLGTWQSIFFIELDGPRSKRGVELQLIGEE